uniref:Putative secreted protein n=1 Tax=Amblyomma cajennense TaxID=34607 RepID=A0A023FFA6_AMBCJ
MAASGVAQVAGIAVIFATLVLCQGEEKKLECDVQTIWACYTGIADQYGVVPLTNTYDKNYYLENLCQERDDFPAEPRCKVSYPSCSEDEKKKFTAMERGYTALREATSDSQECKSVALLRDCMDLEVIAKCDAHPENVKQTFEGSVEANKKGTENLKACLKDAVKPCAGKQYAQSIAHLDKIATAIVDLHTFSDGRNSASRTNAAMAAIAAVSLSWLARSLY